jgi:hypothetical protein
MELSRSNAITAISDLDTTCEILKRCNLTSIIEIPPHFIVRVVKNRIAKLLLDDTFCIHPFYTGNDGFNNRQSLLIRDYIYSFLSAACNKDEIYFSSRFKEERL